MAVNEENEDQPRGRKLLPLDRLPGMIQGVPSAVVSQARDEESEQTVAGAAAQGFTGGFLAGAQNRTFGAPDGGERAPANPSWQRNNREVVALNTKIMAASAENIALMDRDIAAMNHPAHVGLRVQRIAARAKALEGFRAMQESMARDQVNVDMRAGAHTDADVQALRQTLSQLHGVNDNMRATQQQRGGAEPLAKSRSHTAPVRNADGKSLADLTAPAPGEDLLPGTSQPLLMDALDAVRGSSPRLADKGIARAVIMNPAHVAALASLDNGDEAGLESSGSHFGR